MTAGPRFFVSSLTGFFSGHECLLRRCALCLLPVFVVAFSVWQGAYNSDAHHWGLMLSNATDLLAGRIPYKEIFIQYGILTTLIQAGALALTGPSLRSLILVTALAYATGLLLIYFLSLRASSSRRLALYAFATATMLHPLAIYPWSNYIAFPFLVGGTLLALNMSASAGTAFCAGLLLAMAVLSREGLLPAVLLFSLAATLLGIIRPVAAGAGPRRFLVCFWVGFTIPIAMFFAWLWQTDLYRYWHIIGVQLPRMYAGFFLKDGVIGSALDLAGYLLGGVLGKNSRIRFLGFIALAAGAVILAYMARHRSVRDRNDLFLLAWFSALLLSASLHLNEIFRLATSITIGTVLVYMVAARWRLENWTFWIFFLIFAVSIDEHKGGNYFFPKAEQRSAATSAADMPFFSGQRWPAATFDFYRSFRNDMELLRQDDCGIRYFANETTDAFLAILAPFAQYQLTPMGGGPHQFPGVAAVRPDLDVQARMLVHRDIVLFTETGNRFTKFDHGTPAAAVLPPGYVVARRYDLPAITYRPAGAVLSIATPEKCAGFIAARTRAALH